MTSVRDADASVIAALNSAKIPWALFYEGIFVVSGVDTPVRFWSGLGNTTWNGFTWVGAGNLLGFSDIEETQEVRATSFSVSLSGLATGVIGLALGSIKSGKAGSLWLAILDDAGAIVGTPYPLRRGRFDTDTISFDGEQCVITVQYEGLLATLDRPRERRWTNEDQQIDYPNDKGFVFVPELQDRTLIWG